MSIKNILFVLTFLMLYSCSRTTEISNSHQIFISQNSSATNINIWEGTVTNKGNYYELQFKGLKYGNSYFLGRKRSKKSPDEYPRLEFEKHGEIIAKYSITEILKMEYQIMEDSIKVYLIPELE